MDFKWHVDNYNAQRNAEMQQRMPGVVYAAMFFVLMSTILVYCNYKAYVADKQVMSECLKYHTPQDCKASL